MRRILPTLLASIGLLQIGLPISGCHLKEQITYVGPQPKVIDSRATITFTDGHTQEGEHVVVQPDSVSWQEPKTMQPFATHSSTVEKVEWKDHGRGATEGLRDGTLIGVLVGACGGLIMMLGEGHDPHEFKLGPYAILLGALVDGLTGALLGLLVGASAGHTTTIKLD